MKVIKIKLPPHTCSICESREYEQAKAILKHSGLSESTWGRLAHDIAGALVKAKSKSKE